MPGRPSRPRAHRMANASLARIGTYVHVKLYKALTEVGYGNMIQGSRIARANRSSEGKQTLLRLLDAMRVDDS